MIKILNAASNIIVKLPACFDGDWLRNVVLIDDSHFDTA